MDAGRNPLCWGPSLQTCLSRCSCSAQLGWAQGGSASREVQGLTAGPARPAPALSLAYSRAALAGVALEAERTVLQKEGFLILFFCFKQDFIF